MKVSLTMTLLPPPHLARAGAQPERLAKEISETLVGVEIDAVIHHAAAVGLFDAGGCVNVVIQRAALRAASEGPG